jgi:hypothetical protein
MREIRTKREGFEQSFFFELLRKGATTSVEKVLHSQNDDTGKDNAGIPIDEKLLLNLLQRHRLLPLADTLLKKLPEETRSQWKKNLQQKTLRSHQLLAETLEIIAHFREAGISILPLKGAILAHTLYGDTGARHFNDIDLLVSKEDLGKSRELLQQLNYRQQYPDSLPAWKWRIYSTFKKDMGFLNREKMSFVELHYGIYVHELLRNTDESRILNNTEHIAIKKTGLQVLDRETTFVYLVYHGCLHQYFRLFWLRDVAECLVKWEMNHEKVIRLVRELGFQRLLTASLHLARYYFNITIPDAYSPFLKEDATIQQLLNSCHKRIRNPEQLNLKTKISKHLYLMKLKPGRSYKWAVLMSIFHRWRIRKFMGGH